MNNQHGSKQHRGWRFLQGDQRDNYGYYAVVTGESYGDEIEINYFQKREKNFVIKANDFDLIDQS